MSRRIDLYKLSNMPNNLYEAIGRIMVEYEYAFKQEHIRKPLSYALYQVWKYFDEREKARECTNKLTETKSESGTHL